ncbi:hypothetical protein CBW65_09980 [Tumebacillus avium]|uniref:DUF4878 domain-containing protein n=1 Tax=Tumebacillus avium TaxID=1903704 RepID=A0A1Y0IN86_9BACL|nr:hypothetical protein [Tumebacillus avium]ARU61286.1 hypothetical protein CBW65_09980 [Tumebacillus avium]
MKTRTMFFTTAFVCILTASLLFSAIQSKASTTAEQEARYAVTQYIHALKTSDVQEIMKYTKDLRYPNESRKKQAYTNMAQDQILSDVHLISFKRTDNDEMIATLRFVSKVAGTHELDYPVIQEENGDWKVLIEGKAVTKNNKK